MALLIVPLVHLPVVPDHRRARTAPHHSRWLINSQDNRSPHRRSRIGPPHARFIPRVAIRHPNRRAGSRAHVPRKTRHLEKPVDTGRHLPVRGKPLPPSAAPTGRPATSTKLPHNNTTFPTASSIAHANCPTICIRLPFGGLSPGFSPPRSFPLSFSFRLVRFYLGARLTLFLILVLSRLMLRFVLSLSLSVRFLPRSSRPTFLLLSFKVHAS